MKSKTMRFFQFIEINDDGVVVYAKTGTEVQRRFMYSACQGWENVALQVEGLPKFKADLSRHGFTVLEDLPFALVEMLMDEETTPSNLDNWYRRINEGQFGGSEAETELACALLRSYSDENMDETAAYIGNIENRCLTNGSAILL